MISLSLITVAYNDCLGLKKTISSIDRVIEFSSKATCIEHVIIDGGSTDVSIEYLQELKNRRTLFTTVVSEPDDGIYDAMNKGVRCARGQGLVFLNAGDEIHPECNIDEVLQDLSEAMKRPEEAGLAYCAIMRIGSKEFSVRSREIDRSRPRMPSIHQAMLYKRSVLVSMPYDDSFKICGDYDNFARIFSSGLHFRVSDDYFAVFGARGVSSKFPRTLFHESLTVTQKYFKLTTRQKYLARFRLFISLFVFQVMLVVYGERK